MIILKDKWVFITGASRGIGREISLFMAQRGCNLILHSRTVENLSKVADELKEYDVKVVCVAAELTSNASIDDMLNAIDALEIDVDIIFNNAGLQIAYRNDCYKTPVEDFEISFQVNLIAITKICYHFLPKMNARGFGRIINTTSGISLEAEQAGYSCSKAALNKFTIDLGSKLEGTNVMMNLTDPGWCRTDLGGPDAPNDVKSTLPGVVLPAFLNDKKSSRIFDVQTYSNTTLEEAVLSIE